MSIIGVTAKRLLHDSCPVPGCARSVMSVVWCSHTFVPGPFLPWSSGEWTSPRRPQLSHIARGLLVASPRLTSDDTGLFLTEVASNCNRSGLVEAQVLDGVWSERQHEARPELHQQGALNRAPSCSMHTRALVAAPVLVALMGSSFAQRASSVELPALEPVADKLGVSGLEA